MFPRNRSVLFGAVALFVAQNVHSQQIPAGDVTLKPAPEKSTDAQRKVLPAIPLNAPPAATEDDRPPTEAVPLGIRPLVGQSFVRESAPYEVTASDNASAMAVLHIAEKFPEAAGKFFSWPSLKEETIQLHLVSAGDAKFEGPYTVTVDHLGRCSALVRWTPDTSIADICQAVAEVSLDAAAVANGGMQASHNAPAWLVVAMAKALEVHAKPAVAAQLADQALESPVLSLRQLTTAKPPFGDAQSIIAANAYWLARMLADQSGHNASTDALFNAFIQGIDPAKAIIGAFPDEFNDPRDLELWWQVGYRDYTRAHASPVQTMAQTRAALDELEFLQLPQKDGVTKRTRLDDAWGGRADKNVSSAIEAEIVTGPTNTLKANPVYYNAMVSLLLALKSLHGDDEKAFRDAWAKYLADRADAEQNEAKVETAMAAAKQ